MAVSTNSMLALQAYNPHRWTDKDTKSTVDLLERTDFLRLDASRQLRQEQRGELGQFLTPAPVARLMAAMFALDIPVVSILDAGAGVGSLFAAAVAELCGRTSRPESICVTAYEIDPLLLTYLRDTMELCRITCERSGVAFIGDIRSGDFLKDVAGIISGDPMIEPLPAFSAAILNPPYRKINANSETRQHLRTIGIETTNLYTGFLATAIGLLAQGGELVAITPRSFCNGTYFRAFRDSFLQQMALGRIHLFDSRQDAFRDDSVLQETIIIHAFKEPAPRGRVTVSSSARADDGNCLARQLPFAEIVHPDDPERFIRVVPDGISRQIVGRMDRFTASLADLALTVSTGRVVDFRAKEYIFPTASNSTVPLIYPINFDKGRIAWPRASKKMQHITVSGETESQLVPNEHYVVVKRFTSKEQERRVISAFFEGGILPGCSVGFENHLNYFHHAGSGVDLTVAKGLSLYLNSSLVDAFFRQFNGHTQVSAGDLRSLKYPTLDELGRLGLRVTAEYPEQEEIDKIIEREFFSMAEKPTDDPIATKRRIEEAMDVLEQLDLPRQELNERSALTLLALLDLKPSEPWAKSARPLRGIIPIMDFMDTVYGKRYAPNTHETVRRQTICQFIDAGLVIENPDKPERPANSPERVYQVENSALDLLRAFGTSEWLNSLSTYSTSVEALKERYAHEREVKGISVEIASGLTITLSPGGQNMLVEQILSEFAPRFTPNGKFVYVGDNSGSFAFLDAVSLTSLGVEIDDYGKMPDVIVHYTEKNWLVLVEAVTSHGPINPERRLELQKLFSGSTAGLVLVTTFLSRKSMVEYLPEISWETEVWVAEAPAHMIHFNGERFLGPYDA